MRLSFLLLIPAVAAQQINVYNVSGCSGSPYSSTTVVDGQCLYVPIVGSLILDCTANQLNLYQYSYQCTGDAQAVSCFTVTSDSGGAVSVDSQCPPSAPPMWLIGAIIGAMLVLVVAVASAVLRSNSA